MRKTQQIGRAAFFQKAAFFFLCQIALCLSIPARAAVPETDVKAAFLYNCAKFVEWPQEAFSSENAPIQIGLFGDEEFAGKLRFLLSDKKAHGRAFEVKRLTNAQEAKNYHIVFITASESKRLFQILEATKKSPALTIGESEQFLDSGGMINLVFEDAQIRFEVNPEAAEKVKLVISSKFLRLAKKRSSK